MDKNNKECTSIFSSKDFVWTNPDYQFDQNSGSVTSIPFPATPYQFYHTGSQTFQPLSEKPALSFLRAQVLWHIRSVVFLTWQITKRLLGLSRNQNLDYLKTGTSLEKGLPYFDCPYEFNSK